MITNAPERIWLNYGDTQGETVDHKDCLEVSWCDHRVFNDDVEYVRLDTVIDFVNLPEERKEMLRGVFMATIAKALATAAFATATPKDAAMKVEQMTNEELADIVRDFRDKMIDSGVRSHSITTLTRI